MLQFAQFQHFQMWIYYAKKMHAKCVYKGSYTTRNIKDKTHSLSE